MTAAGQAVRLSTTISPRSWTRPTSPNATTDARHEQLTASCLLIPNHNQGERMPKGSKDRRRVHQHILRAAVAAQIRMYEAGFKAKGLDLHQLQQILLSHENGSRRRVPQSVQRQPWRQTA